MSVLEAIVLGLVQGITEFLPISSTAHLRIVPELLGWGDPGAAYSAIIQLGTVFAVIIFFGKDLLGLARAFFAGLAARKPFGTPEARLAWFVIVGTLPAVIAGLAFKKQIETTLRSLQVVAASMVVLAIFLFLAEKLASHRRSMGQMTWTDSVVIGCCQALALVPGSSRSGTTLTGGLALGLKREDAARYSFLLSIPINTAAAVLELKHSLHDPHRVSAGMMVLGVVVAFGSGLTVIAGLLRFLRTRTTLVFVVYRVVLGLFLLFMLQTGRLHAFSGLHNITPEHAPERIPVEKRVND